MRKKVQILFCMEVFIGPILCIPFKANANANAKGLCTMMGYDDGQQWWKHSWKDDEIVGGMLAFVGSFNYILMAFPSFPLMPYAVLRHTVWLGPFVNSFINNTPAWLLFSFTLFIALYLGISQWHNRWHIPKSGVANDWPCWWFLASGCWLSSLRAHPCLAGEYPV